MVGKVMRVVKKSHDLRPGFKKHEKVQLAGLV